MRGREIEREWRQCPQIPESCPCSSLSDERQPVTQCRETSSSCPAPHCATFIPSCFQQRRMGAWQVYLADNRSNQFSANLMHKGDMHKKRFAFVFNVFYNWIQCNNWCPLHKQSNTVPQGCVHIFKNISRIFTIIFPQILRCMKSECNWVLYLHSVSLCLLHSVAPPRQTMSQFISFIIISRPYPPAHVLFCPLSGCILCGTESVSLNGFGFAFAPLTLIHRFIFAFACTHVHISVVWQLSAALNTRTRTHSLYQSQSRSLIALRGATTATGTGTATTSATSATSATQTTVTTATTSWGYKYEIISFALWINLNVSLR